MSYGCLTYYRILKAKNNCCPAKEDILVTDRMAKLKLQSVLDLTTRRILSICNDQAS